MDSAVKLPVRQLVEFVLRGGSIDNRFGGADRALEGSRIHRLLQRQEGEDYRAEVRFSHTHIRVSWTSSSARTGGTKRVA